MYIQTESKLGDNMFIIEWFAGITYHFTVANFKFYHDASAEPGVGGFHQKKFD